MTIGSHKEIEKKLGIKNNSSEAVLKESQIFQDILACLESYKCSVKSLLEKNENIDNFENEIQDSEFIGYDINELRLLKQALNNIICLAVFQQCLDETGDMEESDIPFLGYKKSSKSLHFRPMPVAEFVEGKHPILKEKQKKLMNPEKYAIIFGDYVKWILASSAHHRIDSKISGAYLSIFESILGDFFHDRSLDFVARENEVVDEHISLLYFFLELVLKKIYLKKEGKYFKSFTSDISLNTNMSLLRRYIYQSAMNESAVPSIDELEEFLVAQGSEERKSVNDGHKTHVRNLGQFVYDESRKVYIPDTSKPYDDFTASLQDFGGCPFAKTRDGDDKNALVHMHQLTDEWYIRIMKELERQGKYNSTKK